MTGNEIKEIIMRNVNETADLMYVDDNINDVIEGIVNGVTYAIVESTNVALKEVETQVNKSLREIARQRR